MNPTQEPPLPGDSRWWLLALLALLAWQGWRTLTLFGAESWQALVDDRPVLSGRHPLHLYHGHLGARTFAQRSTLSCYDPAFQAGYPKTPVFDSGSRPAELFLSLAGGEFRPAAYKLGLAACSLAVPLALFLAGRGLGLPRRAAVLTAAFGLFVWWGRPCQLALHDGDLDLLLAGLCAVVQAGLLIRFDRRPHWRDWLGASLAGFLGWFCHPLLFSVLLPIFLLYYVTVGTRHHLLWSVSLLTGLLSAVACNAFWLGDWVRYWWLLVPLRCSDFMLSHRTLSTLWNAELWGGTSDRAVALTLVALALVGGLALNGCGKRAAARLFGLSGLALILLALGGILSELLAKLNAPGLFVPGLLFAAPLAAHAAELLTGRSWAAAVLALVATALVALLHDPHLTPCTGFHQGPPLELGLDDERREVVEVLRRETTPAARILWEDRARPGTASRWTTLLPVWTERSYIGGLDPDGVIEHTACGLVGPTLAGRPLPEWTDEDLDDYCRRYNVGWVVCRSPAVAARLERWKLAVRTHTFSGREASCLFSLRRPPSFALAGKARWLGAGVNWVSLADLEPEGGEVVLSLHFHEGLRVTPARVQLDRERLDPRDPIGFIRLRVDAPVARLTLTWDK